MKVRGFEVAKGWEDAGIVLPQRSTAGSAAYDLAAAEDVVIPAFRPGQQPTLISTGLKFYCAPDEFLGIYARSSLQKRGIALANGVGIIDYDYYNNPENDGHIRVIVRSFSDQPVEIHKGDRIAQAIFQKYALVDNDSATGQRQGGIGSTGVSAIVRTAPLKVVYDVDDVLWGLNQRVIPPLGIKLSRMREFHIDQNQLLTKQEQESVLAAFRDPRNFDQMNFYPGADEILAVEKYNGTVRVHSNSFNQEIADSKRAQLKQLLPDLKPSSIRMTLMSRTRIVKQIEQDTYIFVDDSPYNIALSAAKFNLMPRYPWNTTAVARQQMCGEQARVLIKPKPQADVCRELDWAAMVRDNQKYVIILPDLLTINRVVLKILKTKQEEQNGE